MRAVHPCPAGAIARALGAPISLVVAGTLAALASLSPAGAVAQEIEPNEYIPLPPGTNLFLGYYVYGHNTEFSFNNGPTLKNNTGSEVNVAVARYVHYTEVLGHPAGYEIYQIFGSVADTKIGGEHLNNAFGAENVAIGAFIWPYANEQAGNYLAVAGWLYPPTGTYDPHSVVNLGDNRWRGDIQIGWNQSFGPHFSYEIGEDTMFYGDNSNAFPGGQRLSQTPTYRLQAFLNWRWTPKLQTSFGYEGFFGGVQQLDGTKNGMETQEQRLRVTASYFITPRWQVLLELNHDVAATGEFKQGFGTTLRVLFAF
jgi:hypothetical protein